MKKPKEVTCYRHQLPRQAEQLRRTPANPGDDDARWRERECFYVSVRDRIANDGSRDRYAIALGPFRTHAEALDQVEAVRTKAEEVDPRAWFYGYGTCKLADGSRLGILNKVMNFEP